MRQKITEARGASRAEQIFLTRYYMPECAMRVPKEHPHKLLRSVGGVVKMRKRNARCWDVSVLGRVMSLILLFGRKWVDWYRVLRYGKAFSFADSIRYGLWLARG
jgi:hypothetical protein